MELISKNPRVVVKQATSAHSAVAIQKVLNKFVTVTGFTRLDSIEKCVQSGFSCVAVLDGTEIIGVSVAYKRKTDGVIKSNASSVYKEFQGIGIWKSFRMLQLPFGQIEWKTTVENPSNTIFAKYARLIRVEPGDKRSLNVWRLVKWDDPLAYVTHRGHPYKFPGEK